MFYVDYNCNEFLKLKLLSDVTEFNNFYTVRYNLDIKLPIRNTNTGELVMVRLGDFVSSSNTIKSKYKVPFGYYPNTYNMKNIINIRDVITKDVPYVFNLMSRDDEMSVIFNNLSEYGVSNEKCYIVAKLDVALPYSLSWTSILSDRFSRLSTYKIVMCDSNEMTDLGLDGYCSLGGDFYFEGELIDSKIGFINMICNSGKDMLVTSWIGEGRMHHIVAKAFHGSEVIAEKDLGNIKLIEDAGTSVVDFYNHLIQSRG